MSHAQARLQRALDEMTVGFERERSRVVAEREPMEPGDLQHQVQIPFNGEVSAAPVTWEVVVTWKGAPFLTRIQVSDDDVEPVNPHFSAGCELQTDTLVVVSAAVREWLLDDSGLIDSARVRLTAFAPGATTLLQFSGIMHLTFTGYAAPRDDDDDGSATPVDTSAVPSGGTDNIT